MRKARFWFRQPGFPCDHTVTVEVWPGDSAWVVAMAVVARHRAVFPHWKLHGGLLKTGRYISDAA